MKIRNLTIFFIIFAILFVLTGCNKSHTLTLESDYFNLKKDLKEDDFYDLPIPETTDYAFVAWYQEAGFTSVVAINGINKDTTLFGRWTNQNVEAIRAFNAAMIRAQGTHDSHHIGGQTELDAAKAVIDVLEDVGIKDALQKRYDLDQSHIADILTTNALYNAEMNQGTQEEIDYAWISVNKAIANQTFYSRLEEAQGHLDVDIAEKEITLDHARTASDYINTHLSDRDHFYVYSSLSYRLGEVWAKLTEQSKTQSVIDEAREFINDLKRWQADDEVTKVLLLGRLDKVQALINMTQEETDATNAVLKAEESLLQADTDEAKLLVDALTKEELIQSLNHRLDIVQDTINYNILVVDINIQGNNFDLTQADIDELSLRANDIKDEQKKADLVTRIDNLQRLLATIANVTTLAELENALASPTVFNINVLADLSTDHPVSISHWLRIRGQNHTIAFVGDTAGWQANYVLDISGHNTVQIENTNLTGGDCAIRSIETGVYVTNVNVSCNEFWGIEFNPGVYGAYHIVIQGELINATEDFARPTIREQGLFGKVFYGQFTRIDQEGNFIYYLDAYNSVDHLGIATSAVFQAEVSVTQETVDSARELVNGLRESSGKTLLAERLDVVCDIITKETEARFALTTAEAEMTQTNVDVAKDLVDALVRVGVRNELSGRLNFVQAAVSVAKAETEKTQGNVDEARLDVSVLFEGDLKTSFTNRLDAVQAYLDKFADVNNVTDFEAALARPTVETINFTGDITTTHEILISRPVIINGHNYTLSFEGDPASWQGNYLLHVLNTTAVVIKDMKLTSGDMAIHIDQAEVELQGMIDVSGNEFGGLELSKGVGAVTDPRVAGETTLINVTEKYGKPTVWENGVSLSVGLANLFPIIKDAQQHYYLVKDHIYDPVILEAVDKAEDTNLLVDFEAAQGWVDSMTEVEGKADLQARLDAIVIEDISLIIYFNTDFILNEPNLLLVGFDANSFEGKEVTVLFTHSEGITLEYRLNEADPWIPINDYFGSPSGFPLESHAYLFRVTCTVPGANTVGIEVRDTAGVLIISKELTVTL